MEKTTMDLIISQGIFAILFIAQYWDNKKEARERELKSQEREEKLQEVISNNQTIIQETVKKLDVIKDVKEDVEEIKNKLNGAV